MSSPILFFLIVCSQVHFGLSDFEAPCDHPIFCVGGEGTILHTVQLSGMYNDSKTFVDRPLKYSINDTLRNFAEFMEYHNSTTPQLDDVIIFVEYNFEKEGTEFMNWTAPDWKDAPLFLSWIKDDNLRQFGSDLNEKWNCLGKKIKPEVEDNPDKYTLIYSPYPVIVPGGRFREFFYWDSYWIQKGLLRSEMYDTVEGMILNFVLMVQKEGYVRNGGRIYFRRSQPPLLIPMVKNYLDATNNVAFLQYNLNNYTVLQTLVKEFEFWETDRSVNITYNEENYRMFRYYLERNGPRPEAYRMEYSLTEGMLDEEKNELYSELQSACESGIDFSSRWFQKDARVDNLTYTKARNFIPADLNGYLFYNAKLLAEFHYLVGDGSGGDYYLQRSEDMKKAINAVLWDEQRGCWFDYNYATERRSENFYPSNIVPLWAGAQESATIIDRVIDYLEFERVLDWPGGIPSSTDESGEQWDFPNSWAPFEDLMVEALDKSRNPDAQAKAFDLAQKYVWTTFLANYKNGTGQMYEKYDVTELGRPGGGGRYDLVVGFGWTNGVVIDFLSKYGDRLKAPEISEPIKSEPCPDQARVPKKL